MDYVALGSRYLSEISSYLESKKIRRALIVLVIIGVGAGGFYINRYMQNSRQQKAISAFNEAMQTYVSALVVSIDNNRKEVAPWDEVELAFQMAYQQNNSASFAPFFLIYSAQALAAQHKYDEAAKLVGDVLSKIGTKSPFYDLYSIMQANLLIDAGDQTGVEQLKRLADNSKTCQDAAQYYLAQYYLAQNQNEYAQALFKQLSKEQSVWGKLAQNFV